MNSRNFKLTQLFFNQCKESWNLETHWNSAAAAFIWRESNCSDSSWVECNVGGDYMEASFSLFTVLSTEEGIHYELWASCQMFHCESKHDCQKTDRTMIPHVSLDFVLYVHKGNITSQKVYRPWRWHSIQSSFISWYGKRTLLWFLFKDGQYCSYN